MSKKLNFHTRTYNFWEKTKKSHLIIWGVLHLLLIGCGFLLRPVSINTSLFAILPPSSNSELIEEAGDKLSIRMNSRIRILVGASDYERALAAAGDLVMKLEDTPGVKSVQYKMNTEALNDLRETLRDYRYSLLDEDDQKLLREGSGGVLADDALFELYSPFSIADFGSLDTDPFLLTERQIKKYTALSSVLGENVEIIDDVMSARHEGRSYIFISAILGQDHDSVETGENVIGVIRSYFTSGTNSDSDLEFLPSGFSFHNEESARKAQKEISWIGTFSIIVLILVLILVFRSPVPIVSSIFMILTGTLSAFSVTLFAFKEIHMFTLVLGTSLIGVTIDYAFHFFVEWMDFVSPSGSKRRSRGEIIKSILPGIGSGMFTTVISYTVLLFVPIPLLRQIALFSIVGITSAFFTVLLLFPYLRSPKKKRGVYLTSFFENLLKTCQKALSGKGKIALGVVVFIGIIVVVIGIKELRLDNDIRKIYSMSDKMAYSERMNNELPGTRLWNGHYLIFGSTIEDVLQKEEAFLHVLGEEKWFSDASLLNLTTFLPSEKRQKESYRLVGTSLSPLVKDHYSALGFDETFSAQWMTEYGALRDKILTPKILFQSDTAESLKDLWLGQIGDYYATVIFVAAPVSDQELRNLCENEEFDKVFWMNTAADISSVLQRLCKVALLLVGGAYLFIFLLLCVFYGWRDSFKINSVPLLAAILTLGVLGLTHSPFNLFAVFGLILTLGIGIDYTLFLYHQKNVGLTFQAVFLSFVSTLLAFGALALSSFPPVADFGRVIFWGISFSFLLSFVFLLLENPVKKRIK